MHVEPRHLTMALFFASGGMLAAAPAQGATPDAWTDHQKEVAAACESASNLRDPRVGGGFAEFDDRVGYTAVIIDGRYPQPHMKNKRGRVLCLFDKRTRAAFVSPADSLARRPSP